MGESEAERRANLVYWLREGMRREHINSDAEFARLVGVPKSTVSRWLKATEQATPSLVWLGKICQVLRVRPSLFAVLPTPPDPLAEYALGPDEWNEVVTDATQLAQRDSATVEEPDPPADALPEAPPDKPRRRGRLRCLPG